MKIENFPGLLSRVLHGERKALTEFDAYRSSGSFEKEHVEEAVLAIQAVFAGLNHPHQCHAFFLCAYMHEKGLGGAGAVNPEAAIALYEQAIALDATDALKDRAPLDESGPSAGHGGGAASDRGFFASARGREAELGSQIKFSRCT